MPDDDKRAVLLVTTTFRSGFVPAALGAVPFQIERARRKRALRQLVTNVRRSALRRPM
jgi:hypothetical protein